MGTAVQWLGDLILDDLAIVLCILAVAFVGFTMLTGRLPLRNGAMVILGTFVLLGAPTIAAGLIDMAHQSRSRAEPVYIAVDPELAPREELSPATYNPYAGASMRRGHADFQD